MSSGRKVLIVDDDVAFADFIRAAVESVGHQVVIATNGVQGTEAFAEERPDLVFLDLLLPKRDGFKVCQDIRSHPQGGKIPIVMMTGIYKKVVYEREGLEKHGANAYIHKPFGVREIWNLLDCWLGAATEAASSVSAMPALPTAVGESLAGTPLAILLARHRRLGSTGVLFVRGTDSTYVLYLRDGDVEFLRSNDVQDRLDQVLLRTGRVQAEQLRACVALAAESRGKLRLGQALVSQGVLSTADMQTCLQLQMQLIARRACSLAHGHALFVAGEHPTEEDVHLRGPWRAILFRSALHAGSDEVVHEHLPKPSAHVAAVEVPEDLRLALVLGRDEKHLLELTEDRPTVERLLAIASAAGLDGPRLLLAFTCADLVRVESPAATDDAPHAALAFDAEAWSSRPFAAAFATLVRERATGLLTVVPDGSTAQRRIRWRRGAVVGVDSPRTEDRLAKILPHLGVVENEPLNSVLRRLGENPSDDAVAVAIAEAELLSPTEIYWARTYQAHAAVHALLAAPSAELTFVTRPPTLADGILPDVPTAELVLDSLALLDANELDAFLPPDTARVRCAAMAEQEAADLPLSAVHAAVLGELSSTRSFGEWLSETGADDERASRRLAVAGLCCTGLLEVLPEESAAASQPQLAAALKEAGAKPRPAPEPSCADDEIIVDVDDALTPVPRRQASDTTPGLRLDLITAREPKPLRAGTAPECRLTGPVDTERVARDLAEVAPLLRLLRRAFDGNSQRVPVDRQRMAELFDTLLEIAARAGGRAAEEPVPGKADDGHTATHRIPAGSAAGR